MKWWSESEREGVTKMEVERQSQSGTSPLPWPDLPAAELHPGRQEVSARKEQAGGGARYGPD